VSRENIWIDPGIGFGKTLEHNLSLIRHLETFVQTGFPVLLGVSRKSYLVKILGESDPTDRLEGTLATELYGAQQGVAWIRTHDVEALSRALKVQNRILESS
jgi:dihydropteroate synthase